jgi:hypothetical protein
MKQGRTGSGGVNRQEGAKPWRRNVPGEANPGGVDSRFLERWKGRDPMGVAVAGDGDRGRCGQTLQGSGSSGEDHVGLLIADRRERE